MNIAYYIPSVNRVVDQWYYLQYQGHGSNYIIDLAIQNDPLTDIFMSKQYTSVAYTGVELPSPEAINAFINNGGGAGSITAVCIVGENNLIGTADQSTTIQLYMPPPAIGRNPHPC